MLAQQHVVRLVQDGQRKEEALQFARGNSYPLIIRLETLTQQAAADGKQLQQVGRLVCSCVAVQTFGGALMQCVSITCSCVEGLS